jgi:Amt family ammonium transporter
MNSGDTTWVLICSALVLLMTPGLAFFYGGLVRERSAINTIKMSFIAMGVIAVEWALVGYSLAFAPGNWLLGGLDWVGLSGVGTDASGYAETVPHLAFMVFQMMFAVITPALISGAVVERMRFKSYVLFIMLWSLVVYVPLAHWVWGDGGWIGALGALDFAGGTVVHVSAGVSALVAALMLGPRRRPRNAESKPHNVPFVVLGASLLWFGWFGFNAGSALAADGIAVTAMVNTMLAASAALTTWFGIDGFYKSRPSAVGAAIGAVVGLVAITPAAGFVTPLAALAIGAIAAVVSRGAMRMLSQTGLDDTLDVFACHGLGGVTGALLTGVFATTDVNPGGADGLLYGGGLELLGAQTVSVFAGAGLAAVGTAVVLVLVRALAGLRTSARAEHVGLDVAEHAESAYTLETLIVQPAVARQQ